MAFGDEVRKNKRCGVEEINYLKNPKYTYRGQKAN